MEKSVTAILIKCEERKDNDYLARLFCADGIITAVMRGVRKASSKMKYAAQPFAFCVYELSGRNTPVVSGVTQIEDFSAIASDIINFTACSVMLEAADYSASAVDCADSFISLLKCIKAVIYGGADARLAAMKYLQKLLHLSGFYRPQRSVSPVVDARSLSENVAASYLEDIADITAPDEIINAALCSTVSTFEKFFFCQIKSSRFFG